MPGDKRQKSTKRGPKEKGMTALQRQLLMVDDDESLILQDDRDSFRIGQYIIGEKI